MPREGASSGARQGRPRIRDEARFRKVIDTLWANPGMRPWTAMRLVAAAEDPRGTYVGATTRRLWSKWPVEGEPMLRNPSERVDRSVPQLARLLGVDPQELTAVGACGWAEAKAVIAAGFEGVFPGLELEAVLEKQRQSERIIQTIVEKYRAASADPVLAKWSALGLDSTLAKWAAVGSARR